MAARHRVRADANSSSLSLGTGGDAPSSRPAASASKIGAADVVLIDRVSSPEAEDTRTRPGDAASTFRYKRAVSVRWPSLAGIAVTLVLGASLASGCGGGGAEHRVELAVFAASSLTESFEALETSFEQTHPEVDVRLTFAGSQVLRLQLERGAAADVFAAADEGHMQALLDAGRVQAPRDFAGNGLVVIVPKDNPAGLERFGDLARAQTIVVGAETVPVGVYTQRMLDRVAASEPSLASWVRAHVVSEESNARLVRAKVELGEADAAVVYRTDASASDRVRTIEVPKAYAVQARYPIAVVSDARQGPQANAFVAHVLSEAGQGRLSEHGFLPAAR